MWVRNMKISELDLKEFRGIKAMKNPMKLSRFNVLIGRNNSGKSSILQALFLFPTGYARLQERVIPVSLPAVHRMIFLYSGKSELKYNLVDNHPIELTIEIDASGSYHIFVKKVKNTEPISVGIDVLADMLQIKDVKSFSMYIPSGTLFSSKAEEYIREHEAEIVKKSLHEKVAEFISRSIDEKFTEVIWTKKGLALRREDKKYINIEDLGSGARKVVTNMLVLENINPSLILWDDFDAGMHPSMIKAVLEWLNSHKDWQIVLSTHSIDVLYHLTEIEDSDDVKVHMLRKNNDILESKAIGIGELEDLIDANTDPRLLIDVMDI